MKRLVLSLLFCVSSSFAELEPLGLVLSGGGAKGAYEVGAWQAMVEEGLADQIKAISGTSVGAINAALFAAVGKPDRCAKLWEEEIGGLFQFNTNLVVKVLGADGSDKIERAYAQMRKNIDEDLAAEAKRRGCPVEDLPREVKDVIEEYCESVARKRLFLQLPKFQTLSHMLYEFDESRPAEGFLPSSKLHTVIMRELPKSWPRKAPLTYATTLRKEQDEFTIERFLVNREKTTRRADMICASACIPIIFGMVDIDGKTYVDGGWESRGGDNVPIKPILENHPEIRKVIVVYLEEGNDKTTKARRERVKKEAEAAGVEIFEIIPSKNLGGAFGIYGVFDVSPDTARRLIELGRKDAEKVLRGVGLIGGLP